MAEASAPAAFVTRLAHPASETKPYSTHRARAPSSPATPPVAAMMACQNKSAIDFVARQSRSATELVACQIGRNIAAMARLIKRPTVPQTSSTADAIAPAPRKQEPAIALALRPACPAVQ